ncbi:MAG: aminotransferase class V-fold PLP-dependent enzyme [Actinomycetota bacterium]|nr:aminotransferase class V-fold PLP-dependent enzyme [Actinomycetota bacterium]
MDELLRQTADLAADFLRQLPERPVGPPVDSAGLQAALGGPLPDGPVDPGQVITDLAAAADPGIVASAGPRYFGFVIGGSTPAGLAADWLTATWDANAGMYVAGPSAAVIENVAAGWVLDLLGLPPTASVGFVTGATMASFTCLAAARHAVLAKSGWDAERDGLFGAPAPRVVIGAERHVTIDVALRYLGLGSDRVLVAESDQQGAMLPEALRAILDAGEGPAIVCAQAGNVNTGAIDPLAEICEIAHGHGAWVHVDGAFGLWAAATPALRPLLDGVASADSWATDGHKWLNVPYDSGLAIVADAQAHVAAMCLAASYLIGGLDGQLDAFNLTPESSRRARGIPIYATLRSLGRSGVADLVERCCALANRFAVRLGSADGVEILNDVVLNQVLVRFADSDEVTREVIARVQADGTCWAGGTTWQGRGAMRISVSNWSTTEADIDRSADAILRAYDRR